MADMKSQIETRNIYYYPDILVTCDPRDREFTHYKKYPCLIVEVLSPNTEAFDRGDKFFDDQQLDSLQEYVLISQKHQRLDCFRRNSDGLWTLQFYDVGSEIRLESVNFQMDLDALYEDVIFPKNDEEQTASAE